jgi:hypothetical protein
MSLVNQAMKYMIQAVVIAMWRSMESGWCWMETYKLRAIALWLLRTSLDSNGFEVSLFPNFQMSLRVMTLLGTCFHQLWRCLLEVMLLLWLLTSPAECLMLITRCPFTSLWQTLLQEGLYSWLQQLSFSRIRLKNQTLLSRLF